MTGKCFSNRNVKEWRNIDKNAGVFIAGRSEEWDKRPTCDNLEQRQKKQMEIVQANTNNGLLQVIRTQVVTKSSSKSNISRVLQVDPSSKLETLLVCFKKFTII